MSLKNWPEKYTRINFFQLFLFNFVCVFPKDSIVEFLRNSDQHDFFYLCNVIFCYSISAVEGRPVYKRVSLATVCWDQTRH